MFGTAGPCDAC